MNQHFINFLIIKVRLAGGAPAQRALMLLTPRRQRLHSVMPVCKQPVATLVLHATAKAARAPPCTLPILGRRFILSTINYNFLYSYFFTHLLIISTAFELVTEFEFGFFGAVEVHEAFRFKDHFAGNPVLELFNAIEHFSSRLARQ